jgi:hypothetical protein
MHDFYLRFTDKEQADAVLYTKVPTTFNEEGEATEWMDKPNYDNINVIGTIYRPTGTMLKNDEGMDYPEMKTIEGYHVNIRNYTEAPELEQYAVVPTIPQRVWG